MNASCVIVTRGDRPAELARAVASARAQEGAGLEVVVVAARPLGEDAEGAIAGARVIVLHENIGPPGARNAALPETSGEVIFFLDDDAWYPDPSVVTRALRLFEEDPNLGIVSFRIVDPDGGPAQRRHVPRLRAGDPARSSEVTTFLEGACAVRRAVFDRAGLFPEEFFFGHEGTDVAWRALDHGFRVAYAGDVVVHHPATPPTRHRTFHYLTARNRVFLARRNLPWPLAVAYCLSWVALTLARAGSSRAARESTRGFLAGMREPCGPRRPIRWRTAWRMTLIGRPPVI